MLILFLAASEKIFSALNKRWMEYYKIIRGEQDREIMLGEMEYQEIDSLKKHLDNTE